VNCTGAVGTPPRLAQGIASSIASFTDEIAWAPAGVPVQVGSYTIGVTLPDPKRVTISRSQAATAAVCVSELAPNQRWPLPGVPSRSSAIWICGAPSPKAMSMSAMRASTYRLTRSAVIRNSRRSTRPSGLAKSVRSSFAASVQMYSPWSDVSRPRWPVSRFVGRSSGQSAGSPSTVTTWAAANGAAASRAVSRAIGSQ